MKLISKIIVLLAVPAIIYGYWGAFTASGNKVYDEMDAMFPFFIMIVGVVVLCSFLIVVAIKKLGAKK
jgi:hypothetical protein